MSNHSIKLKTLLIAHLNPPISSTLPNLSFITGRVWVWLTFIPDDSNPSMVTSEELFQVEEDAVFVNDVISLLDGNWDVPFETPLISADIDLPVFRCLKSKVKLPKRVLVVEDNEINQKVMISMLTRMGGGL